MSLLSRTLSALVVVGLLAVAPPSHASQPDRTRPVVVHRVVWDREAGPGIHLRSARLDGADSRDIYDAPSGFIEDLTMDRRGRRVAFAPCCQDRFPQLVVVPVLGGKALTPLAHHREIFFVGGIGWSPDDRRLVFEGTVDTDPTKKTQLETSLWTIRPDGSGLHRVLLLPRKDPDSPVINDALAWTRQGILYTDGTDLRVATQDRSCLFLSNAYGVRISGDGTRILTSERHGDFVRHADGSRPRKVDLPASDPATGSGYSSLQPAYDGSRLLALRETHTQAGSSTETVVWTVANGVSSARPLRFVGASYVVTWN